jgi:hypothetical protein
LSFKERGVLRGGGVEGRALMGKSCVMLFLLFVTVILFVVILVIRVSGVLGLDQYSIRMKIAMDESRPDIPSEWKREGR